MSNTDSKPTVSYRYEDHVTSTAYFNTDGDFSGSRSSFSYDVLLVEYEIIRHTPKGFAIAFLDNPKRFKQIRLNPHGKQYAHFTKDDALKSYVFRKERQLQILKARTTRTENLLYAAKTREKRQNALLS